MSTRRYISGGRYYWKTPGEGGWLPREWAYTPDELDAVSTMTTTERMSRWFLRTLLRTDAFAERVVRERLAMTAVRRHEEALTVAADPTRTAVVVAVEDTGISVDARSSRLLTDAAVVTAKIEVDGDRWDAVTLLPRTAMIEPAQRIHVVDHPDDPIPLWAGS